MTGLDPAEEGSEETVFMLVIPGASAHDIELLRMRLESMKLNLPRLIIVDEYPQPTTAQCEAALLQIVQTCCYECPKPIQEDILRVDPKRNHQYRYDRRQPWRGM